MHARSTAFGLSTIGQIAVMVRDVPRAVAFYQDVLGLPFLFEAPGLAFFQAGEVRLMLGLPEGTNGAQYSSIVYFRVEDIRGSTRELESRGVTFTHEPRLVHRGTTADLWLAFFHDPDGNALALMSEVRRRD